MLPKEFNEWHPGTFRPENRDNKYTKKYFKDMLQQGISKEFLNNQIITKNEAIKALEQLNVKKDTAFYEFYKAFKGIDSSEKEEADLMYSLDQILEDYKKTFWSSQYPNIEKRYLRLSSIEGEYSYFYDKETDALYGVDWGEMDDFMAGKVEPLFISFYDFLEWYYSEEDED